MAIRGVTANDPLAADSLIEFIFPFVEHFRQLPIAANACVASLSGEDASRCISSLTLFLRQMLTSDPTSRHSNRSERASYQLDEKLKSWCTETIRHGRKVIVRPDVRLPLPTTERGQMPAPVVMSSDKFFQGLAVLIR